MLLRAIAPAKAEIDPSQMRPTEIVSYPSTDGLTIPAYLTLPKNASGSMPAVVLIHGGPTVRDEWQWDAEVQLLASRGYVVLQPQFRGSSGFGKRFMEAGYGQWGLGMQDDVSAGAKWLAEKGIADPKRICVYGASYGGYAAMWGLIKTPDLFRCGISLAGVSDIEYMLKDDSDRNDSAATRLLQQSRIGDLKTHKQQFNDVSPLKKAALIQAPVLIAHGTRDARVPIEHSEKLVAALKKNDKQYEWIELKGEGHGIAQEENRQRFYQALLDSLDKHIGAQGKERKDQPAAPAAVRD
jgi:dipeptidyl aminopeptidase/acylaminoacyl peptidase